MYAAGEIKLSPALSLSREPSEEQTRLAVIRLAHRKKLARRPPFFFLIRSRDADADKRALETNLQVSLLKIREKELQFYTQNCIAIGTQAALLSGFAYNGIIQVDIPSDASDWLKTMYLCVTTMAMGFELIAVLNSTLCSMLGPGLALRGPDGSMHSAVDGLMLE